MGTILTSYSEKGPRVSFIKWFHCLANSGFIYALREEQSDFDYLANNHGVGLLECLTCLSIHRQLFPVYSGDGGRTVRLC